MLIKADFHIHSCLSPCGSLEMSPSAIAEKAAGLKIEAAALTDHNSALNCRAFGSCCRKYGILPLFGIEVTSIEEAHILCLFKTAGQAEKLGDIIYERLPEVPNNPEKFGDQVYVDENENIIGEVEKYLVSAAEITIDELYEMVIGDNGLFIPAHIDKPVFSIPSQLGFLPQIQYSALETVALPCPFKTANYTLIRNSDAHYPDDIGYRYTVYDVETADFNSIKDAMETGNCRPGLQ